MADQKISELPAAGALTGTELVPVVQDGATVQTTAQDIADLGGGGGGGAMDYGHVYFQSDGSIISSKYVDAVTQLGPGQWVIQVTVDSPVTLDGAPGTAPQLLVSSSTVSSVFGCTASIRWTAAQIDPDPEEENPGTPATIEVLFWRSDDNTLFDPQEMRVVILPLP